MKQHLRFLVLAPALALAVASFVGCGGSHLQAQTPVFTLSSPDIAAGSGFWHWAVYNIPPTTTGLAQGAGNDAAKLPAGAFGGNNDLFDTGLIGGNTNYAGPCTPQGDPTHRYVFTLYALAVDRVEVAGGIPQTATPALFSFVINKAIGKALLGKASFTANFGRK